MAQGPRLSPFCHLLGDPGAELTGGARREKTPGFSEGRGDAPVAAASRGKAAARRRAHGMEAAGCENAGLQPGYF